jgi:hypothetical protein
MEDNISYCISCLLARSLARLVVSRCRILITSNDDLARKIDGGLSDFQLSIGQMEDRKSAGRAHAAYMKLMRDFRRAYAGHENLSGKYQQRQFEEVRKLETKWRPEEREDDMNQPDAKTVRMLPP